MNSEIHLFFKSVSTEKMEPQFPLSKDSLGIAKPKEGS